jgi:5-methylcytosine-specific restriction endonuclease McrA
MSEVKTETKKSRPLTFEERKVLVLNKSWAPMRTETLEKALTKVCKGVARIINPEDYQAMTWEDWSKLKPLGDEGIRTANMVFRIPEVILLNEYNKLPMPRKTFCRRQLYRRDDYRCQYCGDRPGTSELNVDHVIPRAQGGQTTWENCVIACVACNSYKANRTPEQAGMKLLSQPTRPGYKQLRQEEFVQIDSWRSFLSEAYWSVPLQD